MSFAFQKPARSFAWALTLGAALLGACASMASAPAKVADGVVVGSALVDLVAAHGKDAAGPIQELTAALSQAIKSARN